MDLLNNWFSKFLKFALDNAWNKSRILLYIFFVKKESSVD